MANEDPSKKDGMTVKEIENFGKRYRFEIFFCLVFLLSSLFSSTFYGWGWNIYLAGLGGIIGVWIPRHIKNGLNAVFRFSLKQEKITRIVLAVVGVIISIFLTPLVFLCVGLVAGKCFHCHGIETSQNMHKDDD